MQLSGRMTFLCVFRNYAGLFQVRTLRKRCSVMDAWAGVDGVPGLQLDASEHQSCTCRDKAVCVFATHTHFPPPMMLATDGFWKHVGEEVYGKAFLKGA